MKLSAKIILGFILTNIIYVTLSIVIFSAVLPAGREAEILSRERLPMLEGASLIQYSIARECQMIQAYRNDVNPEILVKSLVYNADVVKNIHLLKKGLAEFKVEGRDASGALQTLEANYKNFRALADTLPAVIQAVNNSLEAILFNSEGLKATLSAVLSGDGLPDPEQRDSLYELTALVDRLSNLSMRAHFRYREEEFKTAEDLLKRGQDILAGLGRSAELEETGKSLSESLSAMAGQFKVFKAALAKERQDAGERDRFSEAVAVSAAALREADNQKAREAAAASGTALRGAMWILAFGLLASLALSAVSAIVLIRGITRPLNAMILRLTQGSQMVEQASGALSSSAHDLLEGVKGNSASLSEIASAVEELNSMTQRNAQDSAQASDLMAQVKNSFALAEQSMTRLTKAMTDISASGQEIAKIIKLIDEVAFQTNLLALNAAVEAARAGEAGAGFAVVADEVRNLAIRSAEAAKGTSELLAATINGINAGVEMVGQAAGTFSSVEGQVGAVSSLFSEVAEASREQSGDISRIRDSVASMDRISREGTAQADKSARSAQELAAQAVNLHGAVGDLTELVHGRASGSQAAAAPWGAPNLALPPRA
ncbi:MAG: methyl-accepting chemotaxis protein [Candidatus Adiutrix sp.]|jgi:methyl-accepting chemotaxis protein|nr:methyl-accepting chemotaxis protein [Candidatus Adiutrix sp.]